MFYSQFILAKKGPLGTIWIAAHLERKLRKNQVADTDIGVSVDSILSPEVPIALRLSSHLLLGVVRIYSRKVNYLFDDCSEALLKIKQAFRSTAVDLPPEESTAPYHSITLPETFDLDDFELPDNDIFQGNYVDHHVSSREQITLQDTMESVVYSTSQFGLDERFGDGDTSGLDLDEELLMGKVAAVEHSGLMLSSDADPQASVQSTTPLKQVENHEGVNPSSETMLAIGNEDQIECFDGNVEFEYAQAPCTPGLVEEPNMSNVQETSACDDHQELDHNLTEFALKENLENASSKSDLHYGNKIVLGSLLNDMNPDTVECMFAEENGYHSRDQVTKQLKPHGESVVLADQVGIISPVSEFSDRIIATSYGPDGLEDLQNEIASNNEAGNHSSGQTHEDYVELQGVSLSTTTPGGSFSTSTSQPVSEGASENIEILLKKVVSSNVEVAGNLEKLCPLSIASDPNAESHDRTDENLASGERKDSNILNPSVHEEMTCTKIHVIQSHNTLANGPDILNPEGHNSVDSDLPSEVAGLCSAKTSRMEDTPPASGASAVVKGEGCHATDELEQVLKENDITKPSSCEDIQAIFCKSKDPVDNLISKNNSGCDVPAPEKLLSVPKGFADLPSNLLMETTPDKGVSAGGAGSKIISGKKRTFTESTLTQSLNSVEFVGVVSAKRTVDTVPDDDDFLSSILVGRRSSILKVKPTPPEIISTKRPRTAPRVNASKRKVLMDDIMVLHGDTIRQQLTNTEDIRRIRKKAPCTHPEISMIERQFLEDKIFVELIFTGVSTELASLHNQTYDPSQIMISEDNVHNAYFEAAKDLKLTSQNDANRTLGAAKDLNSSIGMKVTKENEMHGNSELLAVTENIEAQPVETPALNEGQLDENHAVRSEVYSLQGQMKPNSVVAEPNSLEHEFFGEVEMEVDGRRALIADEVNPAASVGIESLHSADLVSGNIRDMSAGMVQSYKTSEPDAPLQIDVPAVPSENTIDIMPVEMGASVIDGRGIDANEAAEKQDDDIPAVETESRARGEFLTDKNHGGALIEAGTDIQIDCSAHTKSSNPSATSSLEAIGCSTLVVTIDEAMEEIRIDKQGAINEDESLDAEVEYKSKSLTSNCIYGEEPVADSSYPVEVNVDMKNASVDVGENIGEQEAYPLSMMDAEVSAIDRDDRDTLDDSALGHDTEFLNVDDDDDEVVEAGDDSMPRADETRFLENSGWSSRSRAVAKYLQTLFDKEAEHGRMVIPMENLLAGKTRKEASRMFFEALVLKTRDYIHVEQENPFGNINIKPRLKLMKSDF